MSFKNDTELLANPKELAEAVGLVYVSDLESGYRRTRCGRGFVYRKLCGSLVSDKRARQRIDALAIPPGWRDVLICPKKGGHIQAVGTDEAGRRQYIYHPRWQQSSAVAKFDHLAVFGECLPRIRRRVRRDLTRSGLPKERVLAAVVRIIDKGHLRVGHRSNVKATGARGATTISTENIDICRTQVVFAFRGKSRKQRHVSICDAKVARVVRACAKFDGEFLFQYVDEDGNAHDVNARDVNDYLQRIARRRVTAKDFRTWWGSTLALDHIIKHCQAEESSTERKRSISQAIAATAKALGNTKAVCKSSYIHPGILAAAAGPDFHKLFNKLPSTAIRELTVAETRFAQLLPKLENETAFTTRLRAS